MFLPIMQWARCLFLFFSVFISHQQACQHPVWTGSKSEDWGLWSGHQRWRRCFEGKNTLHRNPILHGSRTSEMLYYCFKNMFLSWALPCRLPTPISQNNKKAVLLWWSGLHWSSHYNEMFCLETLGPGIMWIMCSKDPPPVPHYQTTQTPEILSSPCLDGSKLSPILDWGLRGLALFQHHW